jgi:oligoribonuclease NrnB/cAMP/cGMP phosphodiesterase (DHH superfamily)
MDKPILCIYHDQCVDGFTAYCLLATKFNVEPFAANYNNPPPDVTDRVVYILDFSYPLEVMQSIIEKARHVVLMDHHASAIRNLNSLESSDKFEKYMDLDRSGAMIVFDHLKEGNTFAGIKASIFREFVDYVQDRDLWRKQLDMTEEVYAAIFSYPFDYDTYINLIFSGIEKLKEEGIALLRNHRKVVDELLKNYARPMTVAGYKVLAVNSPKMYASDVASILAESYPFGVCYRDTSEGRIFDLRSRKDGIDVSKIAESYGGGGHKHASGFKMPIYKLMDSI